MIARSSTKENFFMVYNNMVQACNSEDYRYLISGLLHVVYYELNYPINK